MEREDSYRVVFETAQLSGAIALREFVLKSPLAAKHQERIGRSEIKKEVVDYGELKDFEEYEFSHDLQPGTFSTIFGLLYSDLRSRGEDSHLATIRLNANGQIALEDLRNLAQEIIDKKIRIHGIGPKRAALLQDGASFLINLADVYTTSFD